MISYDKTSRSSENGSLLEREEGGGYCMMFWSLYHPLRFTTHKLSLSLGSVATQSGVSILCLNIIRVNIAGSIWGFFNVGLLKDCCAASIFSIFNLDIDVSIFKI